MLRCIILYHNHFLWVREFENWSCYKCILQSENLILAGSLNATLMTKQVLEFTRGCDWGINGLGMPLCFKVQMWSLKVSFILSWSPRLESLSSSSSFRHQMVSFFFLHFSPFFSFFFFYIFLWFSPPKKQRQTAGLCAGVWVGAGHSLAQMQALLENLLPQVPHEKTELIRALIQQLGSVGSQQIRNVAVSRPSCPKKMCLFNVFTYVYVCVCVILHFGPFVVCWRKYHERLPELRPEPGSGRREEQSQRYIRRYVWKNSAGMIKKKNLHWKSVIKKTPALLCTSTRWQTWGPFE